MVWIGWTSSTKFSNFYLKDTSFHRLSDLIRHQIQSHQRIPLESLATSPEDTLQSKLLMQTRYFYCPKCKREFRNGFKLGQHLDENVSFKFLNDDHGQKISVRLWTVSWWLFYRPAKILKQKKNALSTQFKKMDVLNVVRVITHANLVLELLNMSSMLWVSQIILHTTRSRRKSLLGQSFLIWRFEACLT